MIEYPFTKIAWGAGHTAALGAALGGIGGYLRDPEHNLSSALGGAALGGAVGYGAHRVGSHFMGGNQPAGPNVVHPTPAQNLTPQKATALQSIVDQNKQVRPGSDAVKDLNKKSWMTGRHHISDDQVGHYLQKRGYQPIEHVNGQQPGQYINESTGHVVNLSELGREGAIKYRDHFSGAEIQGIDHGDGLWGPGMDLKDDRVFKDIGIRVPGKADPHTTVGEVFKPLPGYLEQPPPLETTVKDSIDPHTGERYHAPFKKHSSVQFPFTQIMKLAAVEPSVAMANMQKAIALRNQGVKPMAPLSVATMPKATLVQKNVAKPTTARPLTEANIPRFAGMKVAIALRAGPMAAWGAAAGAGLTGVRDLISGKSMGETLGDMTTGAATGAFLGGAGTYALNKVAPSLSNRMGDFAHKHLGEVGAHMTKQPMPGAAAHTEAATPTPITTGTEDAAKKIERMKATAAAERAANPPPPAT